MVIISVIRLPATSPDCSIFVSSIKTKNSVYELNKKENIEEVNIDQMSIFEFIGDTNESRI